MKEYYGKSAKNYKQPSDKYIRLFPAIERVLGKINLAGNTVLDVGCGDGILFQMFSGRGFDIYHLKRACQDS
jgi:2-polyprenyl-3-methyl-5-hydroxy-6-metoxy-1,4-benzoquinol methylase